MDKLYFSKGNTKLSNKILIFSLPSVITCPESDDCKNYCYAKKSEKRFKNVLKSRYNNLDLSMREDFTDSVINYIKNKTKKNIIRIHESGDFYSLEYFNKWIEIIKNIPEKKFYCYTKTNWHKDLDKMPNNFNIISSFLPGRKTNVFVNKEEFTSYNINNKKVYLCPATIKEKKKNIKCGENCSYCISHNNIAFLKH